HPHRARPPIEYNEEPLLPALFLFCFLFMTSSKRRYDCHELPSNSVFRCPSHSPPHRARLPIEYNEEPLLPAPFCFLFMTYPQRLFYMLGPQNQHNNLSVRFFELMELACWVYCNAQPTGLILYIYISYIYISYII